MKRYLLALIIGVVGSVLVGSTAFAQENSEQLREQSTNRAAEIRTRVAERDVKLKQDACRNQQSQLQASIDRLSGRTSSLKDNFDTLYSRLQALYETGQVTVSGYESLKAKVDKAKAEAVVTADTLDVLTFELNCTDSEAGHKLAAFREATTSAAEALRAYKQALLEYVAALRNGTPTNQEQNAPAEGV